MLIWPPSRPIESDDEIDGIAYTPIQSRFKLSQIQVVNLHAGNSTSMPYAI